ncbi:MAG: hypothetical protein A2Y38_12705 [Spirochaetes bacterium GWB1_59_5]|nr:MAG: hypothetical protein A2Y38_12705 [Spirochaetes bacterium GWB1_59_5]
MNGIFGSIRFKIVSVIILVLTVSISISLAVMVGTTRENLLGSVRRNLTVNNDILNTVIRNLMLAGEAPIAVQTLQGLKALEEFQEIAIYRKDGTTAFNDYDTIDSVNRFQDKVVFDRTERTERLILENPNFKRVLETNTPRQNELTTERQMEYFFPILNYAQCRSCHGPSPYIRGVAYYRVSTANAYDRINAAGTFLAASLIAMGLAIAVLLILLMQRIVVHPILAIGATVAQVGEGNLDVSIELESHDEFGGLAIKINEMIDGLKTRNRLLIENKNIEARNQENRKYLDNIGQGLLLIRKDFIIGEQYSAFLVQLFGHAELADKPFANFIYPDPASIQEREELEQFLSMVFFNTLTEMEMIQVANPLRDKTLRVGDGKGGEREIIVDVLFARIMDGETVDSVMAIFEDRTQIVRAREELAVQRERRDAELEEISAILKAGPSAFIEFAREADAGLDSLKRSYDLLSDGEIVAALFRSFHSLKGSARYLELRGFERHAHALENLLALIRDGADPRARVGELVAAAARLADEVENIKSINERFRAFVPAGIGGDGKNAVGSGETTAAVLDRLTSMAKSIAADLGKTVRVELRNELGELPGLENLKTALVHLVRNAIDHGLEEGLERVAAGKNEEGSIVIRIYSPAPGEAAVEIADDGRGIDFEAVRRTAEKQGLLKAGEAADSSRLLRFIFRPDFSSRDAVTSTSGRGVGLDAVAEAVRSIGGRISVKTGKNEGTRFTIRFTIKETR